MKKIISLIAAVAMASSAFVTNAFAADALTVESTTKILTNEEFYEFYEEDIPEGKAAYLVSFEVAGLPELGYTKDGGTNKKPTYGGAALDAMEIILTTEDDMTGINQDYSYIVNHSLSVDPGEGFGEGLWTANYAGNFIYPAVASTTVSGTSEDYIQMCFVVDADDVITFTPEGCSLAIKNYTASVINEIGQQDYTQDAGNLTFSPATITLAPEKDPEPTEPTITGDDEGVAAEGGKVWNNVVIEDVALGTNYRVQFTDGVETSDARAIQGLNGIEVNGDATFAVVLKTARTIADVVMNILYDAVQ